MIRPENIVERCWIVSLAIGAACGGPAPPTPASPSGSTIATNRLDVTPPLDAPCSAPALGAPDYLVAPANMLDWSATSAHSDLIAGFRPGAQPKRASYNAPPSSGIAGAPGSTLGANEGRVRRELRDVARRRDAGHALCLAAQRFTTDRPGSATEPSDAAWGDAFADLAVTGKAAFASFVQLHPTEDSLRPIADCSGATAPALTRALDRAYRVASALRGPHAAAARQGLGWIAVSGEDDQPYLPVNVPSTPAPQFLARVELARPRIAIHTRYAIAHAQHPPEFPHPATPLVDGGSRRVAADALPVLAPDAQVLLFIHGMDSRIEESDDLAAALAARHDRNWTVITVDLPTSGYADSIDHTRISPLSAVACHSTPLVDFLEDYLVAFVDQLDAKLHGQLKPRLRAVIGGSLGGNLAMRLGRRAGVPWLAATVAWSPASIWPSYLDRRDAFASGCDTRWNPINDKAVHQSLDWAGGDAQFAVPASGEEPPARRRELFYGGFDWSPVFGLGGPPQAQCWYSDHYRCKQTMIRAARLDRQETYDASYRTWHWRLGAEQLAFSQQQFAPGSSTPLYLHNDKAMLLLSGYDDTCGKLGEWTRAVAAKMVNTPGYARFLRATGHSLDNEHPDYVAAQIAEFLP
jgi:pimeloyl-ACP methyl ester carboxylesterase